MPVTPMMQQYLDIKSQYPDCILFFRLGDFYEMFYEDAQLASKELEITLTGRDCGLEERAPMCGIPFHAADSYIAKLISKNYKIAICEQVEDPSAAKGLVKRDVTRVITPGTVTENSMLQEKRNNYLMCIYKYGYFYGLCIADVSTGDLLSTSVNWGNTEQKLIDEISKFNPSEILVNSALFKESKLMDDVKNRCNPFVTLLEDEMFDSGKCEEVIRKYFYDSELLVEENDIKLNAAGALLQYLSGTQKQELSHMQSIECYSIDEYMVLDSSTRRNLELTETIRDKRRVGSLLWVIDRTVTSMGSRRLRKWIEQPLVKKHDIDTRLDAVEELKNKYISRMEIMELLQSVYDIERLSSRIAIGSANCRDLIALKRSVSNIPYIKNTLNSFDSAYIKQINSNLDELSDIEQLIEESINEDPPVSVKEGNIIKQGYSPDADRLRDAMRNGKDWIARLEASERTRTGIKNLKVGFNKVFGYFIEVTKSNYESVPEDYIRKQTLVNSERYITPELKEMENEILGAEDKLIALEYDLFTQIRDTVARQIMRLKKTAVAISELDALAAFAETADRESYCRPEITDDDRILITEGRHPVVEKMIDKGSFVPNDTLMDLNDNRLLIITGPNMAGKSTYMRQTALIVLMAQIGCFVPASKALVGLVDRIFTRVGASDDLASGQSTFMVEMTEVAHILNNSTSRSLLILDEVGRGTSTYDGLSIAWAVIEHICDKNIIGARTLFATHYHELTDLEGKIQGIKNYRVAVEEKGEDIIFLRKIARGGADNSYGIQVARLAGLPIDVINRAKEILIDLESADISKKNSSIKRGRMPLEGQQELFAYSDFKVERKYEKVIKTLKETDIMNITPIEAIRLLYELRMIADKE